MSYYALDELDESFDQAKEFLLPFDKGLWLRMAVIVFFIGGAFSSFYFPDSGMPSDAGDDFDSNFTADFDQINLDSLGLSVFAIGLIVTLMGFILVFTYLSAVFEFIMYQALEDGEPRIREGLSTHAGNGLKYFVFNGLILLIGFTSLAALIFGFIQSWQQGLTILALMIPVWLILWFVSFTAKKMALPEMVTQGSGFTKALENGLNSFRKEKLQFLAFVFVQVVMGIAAAMISGLVFLTVLVAAGIPLIILGIILAMLHPVLILIPVMLGVVVLILSYFALTIPIQTFIYRWTLNVYQEF